MLLYSAQMIVDAIQSQWFLTIHIVGHPLADLDVTYALYLKFVGKLLFVITKLFCSYWLRHLGPVSPKFNLRSKLT